MSTLPIAGAGFPPLGTAAGTERRRPPGRAGRFIGHAIADVRNVPRYVARYAVLVLALLGLLGLWEARGDGRIPGMMPLRTIDPHRASSPQCSEPGASDAARWQGLSAALAILDQVNPEVASWVREQHEQGRIAFYDRARERDKHGSLAKYDYLRRRLYVHRTLFEENDGSVAAILCHEYRHSRQNPARLFRCALSFVVTAEGDRSITENDAHLYEREARDAIFGRQTGGAAGQPAPLGRGT